MKNLTLIACTLLLAAWGGLAARPQYQGLQDAQGLRDEAQQTLSQDQGLAATLPTEQRRATQLAARSEQLAATLPAREDLSALLRDLRVMADARGVTVSAVARSVLSSPIPGISAITLNLSGAGRYPDVQRFLNDLHKTSRAITTDSGSFTVSQGGLNTTLKLITYARNLPLPKPAAGTTPGSFPPQPTGTLPPQGVSSTSGGGQPVAPVTVTATPAPGGS